MAKPKEFIRPLTQEYSPKDQPQIMDAGYKEWAFSRNPLLIGFPNGYVGLISSEVRVEGLETLDYLDNLMDRQRFTKQADAITFDGEIFYLTTPTKIAIIDHEKKRTFVLQKDGMPDAVVRNPWDKKAKALPDLGDEDYKTMLCVDSGSIETPNVLKPFEEWTGYQELSTVSSSYCSGQLDPRMVLHGLH
ncbi:hypothetical protein FH972_007346 [Carpinus fangiana]|uniref:Uncharacterized protein n=1 Tax=Carpinus fangiana TaxID=176857 RepID=A0A5N6QWX5_9ROSI|nr:hypothetical protein FH972_007346 [Carpinus fangiana]